MNKKWIPLLLVILLAIAIFIIRRCGENTGEAGKKEKDPANPTVPAEKKINRDRGFDRRTSFLKYSQHAVCRMDCRKISRPEVEEIMRDGKINYAKSDVNDRPCPTYALEGITKDDQRVRIVFAQCDLKTKVVTSIDLDTDWQCHCTGDDAGLTGSPHKNQK